VPLAPARQRSCIRTIRAIVRRWPRLPQVACFETAFYRHVPVLEDAFGLLPSAGSPAVGRCDYDGLPFESAIDALPAVDPSTVHGKTIIVHIGDGAGACALERGRGVALATGLGDLVGASGPGCRLEPAALRHLM